MVLKLKTKIAYGFTAIADHALHDLYVTFFLFFMTTAAGDVYKRQNVDTFEFLPYFIFCPERV